MPVSEEVFTMVSAVLFGMVLLWFTLLSLVYRRLESAHPDKYAAMGRPSLFLRNTPAGAAAMLRFLATREHKHLGDRYLTRLSDVALVFVLVYATLFVALSIGVTSLDLAHTL